MDRIFMRKSLIGMMVLVIFLLIEVNAKRFVFPRFHICYRDELNNCHDFTKDIELEKLGMCVVRSFDHCLSIRRHHTDNNYQAAKACFIPCKEAKVRLNFHFGICLFACYERYISRTSGSGFRLGNHLSPSLSLSKHTCTCA